MGWILYVTIDNMRHSKLLFLRNLPVEFYVFLFPSILAILFFFTIHQRLFDFIQFVSGSSLMAVLMGEFILLLVFIVIIIYVIIKSIYIYLRIITYKNSEHVSIQYTKPQLIDFLRSSIFILLVYSMISIVLNTLLFLVFTSVDLLTVVKSTFDLMSYDHRLFGSFVPFTIHILGRIPYFDQLAIFFYSSLVYVMPVVLLVFFLFNKKLFRVYIMSFFLVFMIALPFWKIVPAISPIAMYRFNLFDLPIPTYIVSEMDRYPVSPYLVKHSADIERSFIDSSNNMIAVSTFPSMHAAWATITVFFAIELFWPLGLVLIPWCIMNIIGAVYSEQHFGVDVIFGIILAFIVIFIVKSLLSIEKKYFIDKFSLFMIVDEANHDMRKLISRIRSILYNKGYCLVHVFRPKTKIK